jgi:hypothetical protein
MKLKVNTVTMYTILRFADLAKIRFCKVFYYYQKRSKFLLLKNNNQSVTVKLGMESGLLDRYLWALYCKLQGKWHLTSELCSNASAFQRKLTLLHSELLNNTCHYSNWLKMFQQYKINSRLRCNCYLF